jgi:PAS domain S-box-containing protein
MVVLAALSAGVVLTGAAGAGWWMVRSERAADESARDAAMTGQLEAVSEAVAVSLAADDLTGLRRLVAAIGAAEVGGRALVRLPNGAVVADSAREAELIQTLPESWDSPVEAQIEPAPNVRRGEVRLAGRGRLDVEVHGPEVVRTAGLLGLAGPDAPMLGGLALVGAVGLAMTLASARRLRGRAGGLAAVRDALLLAAAGERDREALEVADAFGPEAQAWNTVLDECERLRAAALERRVGNDLRGRSRGGGSLQSACDAMPHGLVMVDGQLRVTYANGAAAVFFGADRDKLGGRDLSELLTDAQGVALVRSVACERTSQRGVIEIVRGDPSDPAAATLRLTVRSVRREDNAAAMLTLEDITQQKASERARNALLAQATHELRTPLTNIRLYVEQAVDEGENDPAIRGKALNVINQEARRLERIVADMLSVSEIEAGSVTVRKGDVRLEQLFESMRDDYTAQAKDKEIAIAFELPPKMPVIQADRDKLTLAIHNLLGNALKYTPKGGTVTLRADASDAGDLRIDVVDTGIGIADDELEKVFERFYRSKDGRISTVTGTGIGLSLARELIRMHGGDIVVESELNTGSTFSIVLPGAGSRTNAERRAA